MIAGAGRSRKGGAAYYEERGKEAVFVLPVGVFRVWGVHGFMIAGGGHEGKKAVTEKR
jgi:hypothetical protein